MKIDIKISGVEDWRRQFADFSDRRFTSALSTGLTRAAKLGVGVVQSGIDVGIDRPNPRTKSAVTFKSATAETLESNVLVKDRASSGSSPAEYLSPQFSGGVRNIKKFEQALVNAGVMPSGYVTVPGRAAQLDGYGNVSRAQIVAVLTALGSEFSPGYQRVISKSTTKRLATLAKRGQMFILVRVEDRRIANADPGIYVRTADGRRKAVFIFRKAANYQSRLNLSSFEKDIEQIAVDEIGRALKESAARLAGRGGGV